MDYYSLEMELANIECEKSFLLENARMGLYELGDIFYEDEQKRPGIFEKVKKLIEKVKAWFKAHFGKKKKIQVKKGEGRKVKKVNSILSKLKSNVKNPKLWVALTGALAIGGVVAGVKVKHSKEIKREKEKIKKGVDDVTYYKTALWVGDNGDELLDDVGWFDAGETCDVIVDGLDDLYRHHKISYKEYKDRLQAVHKSLNYVSTSCRQSVDKIEKVGEDEDGRTITRGAMMRDEYDANGRAKVYASGAENVNIKRELIHGQRGAHAKYKKGKQKDKGNKELMKMHSKMKGLSGHIQSREYTSRQNDYD